MKDNQTDLTLDVGGRKKTYSVTFDPDDNLSDHKQVSKGNLIKRVYSGEEDLKLSGVKSCFVITFIGVTTQ